MFTMEPWPCCRIVGSSAETTRITPNRLVSNKARVPELHRELFEQIDLTKRRAYVQVQTAAMTLAIEQLLLRRSAELRPLPDLAATLFVLEHATFAATHAASFYRPEGFSLARVLDALADMITRTLLPGDAGSQAVPS